MAQVKASDTIQRLSETKLKLKEFEMLAEKYFHPHNARQMAIIAHMQGTTLDDYQTFDNNLQALRNMHRAMSSSKRSTGLICRNLIVILG